MRISKKNIPDKHEIPLKGIGLEIFKFYCNMFHFVYFIFKPLDNLLKTISVHER